MVLDERKLSTTIREGIMDALANGIERGIGRMFSKGYPEGKPNTIEEDIKGNGWKIMKVFVKEPSFACIAVCPDPNRSGLRDDYLRYEDLVEDLNIYFKDKGSRTVAKDADAKKSQYGYNGGAHLIEFYGAADNTLHEAAYKGPKSYYDGEDEVMVAIDDLFPELGEKGVENVPEQMKVIVSYEIVPFSKGDHDTPDSGGYTDILDVYTDDDILQAIIMDALGLSEDEFEDALYKYMENNWDSVKVYDRYDAAYEPDPDAAYEEKRMRELGL